MPPRGPCSPVKTYRPVNRGPGAADRGIFFIFPGGGSATAAAAAPILERRSRGQLDMRFIPAPGIRDFPQIQSLNRGLFSIPRDVGTPGLGSRQTAHELQPIAPDRRRRARLAGSCKGAGFTQTIP